LINWVSVPVRGLEVTRRYNHAPANLTEPIMVSVPVRGLEVTRLQLGI